MASHSSHEPGAQLSYPTDTLVAIIDTPPAAESARLELIAAGFAAHAIGVQHGARAAERTVRYTDLDPFPRLARVLHVHSIEHEHAVAYEQALRRGQSVIAVYTPAAKDRERALRIIKAHNAHTINFYGKWTVEALEP